jgi:hypothetical protein
MHWMLDLELLLLNSPFLPLGLTYITMPGIFLLSPDGFLKVLVAFNAGLKLILDIFGSSFLFHIFLLY